jgi:hypothetical protein
VLLIDPPFWTAHGRRWSHLVSDASLSELHAFAAAHALPARGFEGDHYDVPEEMYPGLVAAGAVPVSSRELLRRLQASGLRRPKRRGERVLASRVDAERSHRVDAVLSRRAPVVPASRVHVVVRAALSVLVLVDDEGLAIPAVTPGQGEQSADAVRRLVGTLLGGLDCPPQPIGYLRTVELDAVSGRPRSHACVEAVLQLTADPDEVGSRAELSSSATVRWVNAADAAALLPRHLAPFVHGPFADVFAGWSKPARASRL